MTNGIRCPQCRGENPPGRTSCVHCLSSLRDVLPVTNAPSRTPSGPRTAAPGRTAPPPPARPPPEVHQAIAHESRLVQGLRGVYACYAAYLLWLAAQPLLEATEGMRAAPIVGQMLLPAVALSVVIAALRNVDREPFACALAVAGLGTTYLVERLSSRSGAFPVLELGIAVVLWAPALALARSTRIQDEWRSGLSFEPGRAAEVRTLLAILAVFGGTLFVALDRGRTLGDGSAVVLFAELAAVALAASLLLDRTARRGMLPVRCRGGDLALALLLAGLQVVLVWWLFSLRTGRWGLRETSPGVPDLEPLLLIAVAAPLIEEWLFRGVLWAAVRRWAGPGATVLATATLFAILHQRDGGFGNAVPPQLVGGLALGWLRARTDSLLPCVLCHGAYNAGILALFGAWD